MKYLSAILLTLMGVPAMGQTLLVAAAADLAPLERELVSGFSAAAGLPVRITFGSSGMLARQIRAGAPFHLYLSANQQFVKELADSGHIVPGSVIPYATGRLGLWSKTSKYKDLKDLLASECRRVALPNPAHAPYGVAAMELLRNTGIYQTIRPRMVFAENVRQAFEFARSGNVDAVITAWSLVYDKNGILLPQQHPPIVQSGGVVANTGATIQAGRALSWLDSSEGKALLRRVGFMPR